MQVKSTALNANLTKGSKGNTVISKRSFLKELIPKDFGSWQEDSAKMMKVIQCLKL